MKKKIVSLLLGGVMLFSAPIGHMGIPYVSATETWVTEANLTEANSAIPDKDTTLPTQAQYDYHKEELAAFCHFGPNTFSGVEWGENYGETHPRDLFTLTQDFDADTMVRTLKEAGFKRLIVTAKHHDGFCIWASDETEYDVASSNYKNGQGDILAEISEACTTYDMDMGLYLSPWDIHEDSYGYYDAQGNPLVGSNGQPLNNKTWEEVEELDVNDYNEFYKNQLLEVLGNDKYGNGGRFVEVWMDGAKGSGASTQNYTFEEWFAVIETEEPGCLLFGAESYTTVRWIGNEIGYANEETWAKSTINRDANTIESNRTGLNGTYKGVPDGNQWTVPEADARITSGWFWGNSKKTPKTMEELANMYFNSVGHNATLLLNVPPNNQGTVDQDILDRVTEFGDAVKNTFAVNLADGATVKASNVRNNDLQFKPGNVLDKNQETYWTTSDGTATGTLLLELDSVQTFDVVSIEEAIQFGQRISSFTVQYRTGDDGEWKDFATGTTIGGKRLCRDGRVKADQIKITVTAREKVPMITEVGLYKTTEAFKLTGVMPSGLTFIDESDSRVTWSSGWNNESGSQFEGGTGKWANPSAEFTVTFEGSKIYLIGTKDPNHGTADVYIDGEKVDTINTNAASRGTKQVIYESPDLAQGSHTIKLVSTNRALGYDGAYVINNGGKGMIGMESDTYTMYEEDTMDVVINRVGGSTGAVTATLAPNPGSAIQDDFDTTPIPVSFADGQTQATVQVSTRRNTNTTGDQVFYLQLESPSEGLLIGFEETATVTIKDTESITKEMLQALITQAEALEDGSYASGQAEFLGALEAARGIAADDTAESAEITVAYKNLERTMDALVPRGSYTAEDPFLLPTAVNSSKTLEAELGILNNTGTNERWPLAVASADWASQGKFVNCLNSGDSVTYHFRAEKAGIYTVTATYRSGSSSNALHWSGTNVVSGNTSAGSATNETGVTKTVSFDIEVSAAGDGTLVFTAPTGNSPQLDKLEFSLKSAEGETEAEVDITVIESALEEARAILADGKRYPQTAKEALNTAITEAEAILEDTATTQEAVDEKAAQLRSSIEAMIEINTTTIDKALTDAQALLNNGKTYEEASLAALNTAIEEAQVLLANLAATQEMLNEGAKKLNDQIGAMVEAKEDETIDTTALNKALTDAQAVLKNGKTYEAASIAALNAVIAEAKALLANQEATQAMLDAGTKKLNDQIAAMVEAKEDKPNEVVDATALNKALTAAQAVLKNGKTYEAASITALNKVINEAKALLANKQATQAMLDAGAKKLNTQIGAMVEVKDTTPKPWPFTDIKVNSGWKYDNVKYVYENGIMNGISGTKLFDPDAQLNRAMFATVLHRMADTPKIAYNTKFPDVKDGQYYTSAILWAADKKIVSGMSDGTYGVTQNITRAQIAKMLYEYAKLQKYDVSGVASLDSFTDKDKVRTWAVGYMKWAVDAGMISGKPNGDGTFRLDPDGFATRAECAKMLTMFMQKYVEK